MQPAIHEVRSDVEEARPLRCIRDHERDVVFAQDRDVFFARKALMAYLHGMSQGAILFDFKPCPSVHKTIVIGTHIGSLFMGSRQEFEKAFENLWLKLEAGRKLPQNWSELLSKPQNPLRAKVGNWPFAILQPANVRNESRRLHRKNKILRGLLTPVFEAWRLLERIERTVQLDAVEMLRSERELLLRREFLGIKGTFPALVLPAGDTDANISGAGHILPVSIQTKKQGRNPFRDFALLFRVFEDPVRSPDHNQRSGLGNPLELSPSFPHLSTVAVV